MNTYKVTVYGMTWSVAHNSADFCDVWTVIPATTNPPRTYKVFDWGTHVHLWVAEGGNMVGHKFPNVRTALRAVSADAGVSPS